MPDWILHLGAADALLRHRRTLDLRWLWLGAVLPDVFPRVAAQALYVVPGGHEIRSVMLHVYLSFLHTPFSVALMIVALVAVARGRGMAAFGLAFGAVTHFVLDGMQRSYGGGSSLLYPFDVALYSWPVCWYENPGTYVAVPALGAYLVWMLVRGRPLRRDPPFRGLSAGVGGVAGASLVLCFALPFAFFGTAVEHNLRHAAFALDPAKFEGEAIELTAVAVTADDPDDPVDDDYLYVDAGPEPVPVLAALLPGVEPGDHVSVRGTYLHGELQPDVFFVHDYPYKRAVSQVGAVFLALLWWPSLRAQWRRSRREEG